jgi:hypothetical protein
MTTIMQYPEGTYKLSDLKTVSVLAVSHSTTNAFMCFIKKGLVIPVPVHEKKAIVRQDFYIQLVPVDEGFVATSSISDIYEQETSVGNVVRNYLYSLVDELIWLDTQKENLSASLLDQFHSLQSYISIV